MRLGSRCAMRATTLVDFAPRHALRVSTLVYGLTTTQPEQGGRRPPWTPRKLCCRRPSREPEGTRRGYRLPSVLRLGARRSPSDCTTVPGRCPGIERGSRRLVLRTNERCPVLKRPPTARGHICNRRPVASRAEGDRPFYVVQHATTVDRETIVWDCAGPRATAASVSQDSSLKSRLRRVRPHYGLWIPSAISV